MMRTLHLGSRHTLRRPCSAGSFRHVKVIAYSGSVGMLNRTLPGTFAAILGKPATPRDLLAIVQQYAAAL